MEEIKYISVKEFAERAGVSTQAIYKQTQNTASRLQPYISRKGKHTYISVSALTEVYNVGIINQPTKTNQNNDKTTFGVEKQPQEQPIEEQPLSYVGEYIGYLKAENNQLHTIINQLQTQIDNLTQTIQEKDRLLAEQNTQLAELTQSMLELSNRALTATTNQQHLSAMDKAIEEVAQPRKGIIKRLFGR